MAGISVHRVSKSYELRDGQKLALHEVDLEVRDGEFICLLGPSGCGKSTLLNILSGMDSDYQGSLRFTQAARKERTASETRPVMSYMFQDSRLLPWLTVRENIRFVLDGRRTKESSERIERWLERVGLNGYGDYYPMQLSTGMQQRVSVARALIRNPELLFMDEPFSSLDELTALRMREELLELWREQGCTVVFVTHNPLEAVFLADRVVIMTPSPGRIVEEMRLDAHFPRPRDTDDPRLWELSREAVKKLMGGEHERKQQEAHC